MSIASNTMMITALAAPIPIPALTPELNPSEGGASAGEDGSSEAPADAVVAAEPVDDVEAVGGFVAVIASEPRVVSAFPAVSMRKRPMPVSQQSVLCWQQ